MRMLFGILFLLLLSIAGTAHANSYTDNGNGTITDNTTGLIWQKATVPGNWTSASSYCSSLNLSGYSDWRLPTVCELTTLVNTTYTPTINPTYFPNTATACYWSSTADVYGPEYAWYVNFYGGFDGDSNKSNDYYFRAVRGGQSGSLGNSIISVSPPAQNAGYSSGTTTFSVSNTGSGTMPWTAAVTSGGSWLSIISGASGTNSGVINCSFTGNTGNSSRTGTIQVTASGATGSPVNVSVTQAGAPTPTPTPKPSPTPTPTPIPLPGTPVVNPTSGAWTSAPQLVNVSSSNATYIYYNMTTSTDNSTPADPAAPASSIFGFPSGIQINGSSGSVTIPSNSGKITKVKVIFAGYNNSGLGTASAVYSYSMDLSKVMPTPTLPQ